MQTKRFSPVQTGGFGRIEGRFACWKVHYVVPSDSATWSGGGQRSTSEPREPMSAARLEQCSVVDGPDSRSGSNAPSTSRNPGVAGRVSFTSAANKRPICPWWRACREQGSLAAGTAMGSTPTGAGGFGSGFFEPMSENRLGVCCGPAVGPIVEPVPNSRSLPSPHHGTMDRPDAHPSRVGWDGCHAAHSPAGGQLVRYSRTIRETVEPMYAGWVPRAGRFC